MNRMTRVAFAQNEDQTLEAGANLAPLLRSGDIVLFTGALGAGKTTMIRGLLSALGHIGPVRSPTFNLIQTFAVTPPVMHADLYRLKSACGFGLEEYFQTHLCLIEWPERAPDLIHPDDAWQVDITFEAEGRTIAIVPPEQTEEPYAPVGGC